MLTKPAGRHHEPSSARPTRRAFSALMLAGSLGAPATGLLPGCTRQASAEGRPLDLQAYDLVFADEFDAMNITRDGRGSTWGAHTPWNGDFGDAAFADPGPNGPFTVQDGILSITARKDAAGRWRSGLIASVDREGNGFSQQYGYFEIRAKLPSGKGLWPAFWLNTVAPPGWTEPTVEIDALEHYGHFPGDFHAGILVWPDPNKRPNAEKMKSVIEVAGATALYDRFNVWGIEVSRETIVFYFNGLSVFSYPTPPEHRNKLMILANLALGSGWPINETPSPSVMQIDYIRAYAPRTS